MRASMSAPHRAVKPTLRALSLSVDTCAPSRAAYTGSVTDRRRSIGQAAEDAAARWLARAGLAVLERNVRFREGEIDLVCRDRDVVVFVEVKCRRAHWGEGPGDAVSWDKRRRLIRLAQHYLRARRLERARCRFDVVAVTLDAEGAETVRHLPSAFDAS
jgi:putative endonuclease